jgi:translation initiation factor eIF-2B subunit delta
MRIPLELRRKIRAIEADTVHGATELTRRATRIFSALVEKKAIRTERALRAALEHASLAIVQAQPAMAPLARLATRVLSETEHLQTAGEIRMCVHAIANDARRHLAQSKRAVARHVAKRIANGSTVMTHSASSAVLESLLYAKRRGKKFSVICTESRPMNEGVTFAATLARSGIPVKLIVDAAAVAMISECRGVFVGCDALLPRGLVNKIGTHGLALAARAQGIPFYAVCDSTKFLPSLSPLRIDREGDWREIIPTRQRGLRAANIYYDLTPLRLLTGVVCELGVLPRHKVVRLLKKVRIHPLLAGK